MKKTFILLSLLLFSLSIKAQSNLRQDSLSNNRNNMDCAQLGSRIIKHNLFEFKTIIQGNYIVSIEIDNYRIFDDEIFLKIGDTYIIDMSIFPPGYYEITIINDINGIEQKFYYLIKNEVETFIF